MALADLIDRILPNAGLVEAAGPQTEGAYILGLEEALSNERNNTEWLHEHSSALAESLADAQLQLEDAGWRRLTAVGSVEFTVDGIKRGSELCRVMAVVNPLIKRAVELRIAYIWGQGVSVSSRSDGQADGEQDINAVVQSFMDDKGNKRVMFGAGAREERERSVATDGNFFAALYTDPQTGRVQVRSVPLAEVQDIITNPDDRSDPWYYKRVNYRTELIVTSGRETFTTNREAVTYHPAVGYSPTAKPNTIDGHPVKWDAPIAHLKVNSLDGWRFGIGDVYAALFWSRAYKEFLEDWARLVKALSRYAWRATTKGRNTAKVRDKLSAVPTADPVTREPNSAGATYTAPEGQGLEAIPKTGATIDSDSGRPLAAMVAAALGLPVTWLLGDPGVTGARATAETLDQPSQLTMQGRQGVWADFYGDIFDYVIDQAIKAPQGSLQGKRVIDAVTGLETWVLAGDQERGLLVEFPELDDTAINLKITGITAADGTGKLPPLTITRLLCDAFEIENVDDIIDQMTDDDGNFVDPRVTAAQSAMDAFNRGEDPAAQFGGAQAPAAQDDPAAPGSSENQPTN